MNQFLKSTEQTLRSKQSNDDCFVRLMEMVSDAILVCNPNGTVYDCNKEACLLFGLQYKTLKGMPFDQLLSDEHSFCVPLLAHPDICIETIPNELAYIHRTGKSFKAKTQFQIVTINAGKKWIISIKQPTEQDNNAAIIQELTEKLKNKDKDHSQLLSIISHDLKGYLNTIIGFSDLLIQDSKDYYDKEQVIKFLNIIRDTGDISFKMLENTLDWARNTMEGINYDKRMVAVSETITNIVNSFSLSLIKKRIAIDIKVDHNLKILTDHNMIEVIFRNLIGNAIKYSQEGDEIHIGYISEQSSNIFYVRDFGIGMTDDEKNKLFNDNTSNRLSKLGTKDEKGTGVGLVMCKNLIAKMDGQIWVSSKKGLGSTFYISCPKE